MKLLPKPKFMEINDEKITITKTDASLARCPESENPVVSMDGTVDYLRLVDSGDPIMKLWKRKVATAIVELGSFLDHRECSIDRISYVLFSLGSGKGQQFILSDFPEGYRLYIHCKGEKDDPRKDHYLYGEYHRVRFNSSCFCRFSLLSGSDRVFRSPNEFALHALWLADGARHDDDGLRECMCKYCGEVKDQSLLNRAWIDSTSSTNANTRPKKPKQSAHARSGTEITFKDYTKLGKPAT